MRVSRYWHLRYIIILFTVDNSTTGTDGNSLIETDKSRPCFLTLMMHVASCIVIDRGFKHITFTHIHTHTHTHTHTHANTCLAKQDLLPFSFWETFQNMTTGDFQNLAVF